ncbi:DUF1778 domain-containing protein [Gilvimarinus chinensis]|uniref:type II toxin-antitoxin system TacA family antitoxin n=1 Tax=Gilvimarinus chinensis TaxID=396005 RepID=UPI00036579DB|nr:DUF1778 domain-containing protein [Gilvimarinus chinensis]
MAKSTPINMRVEPSVQSLLTRAASIAKKDRTAFIVEAACREAENILLNQRLFLLNEDEFAAFEAALTEPPPKPRNLRALLAEEDPWD